MRCGLARRGLAAGFHELTEQEYREASEAWAGLQAALRIEEKWDLLLENLVDFEANLYSVALSHLTFRGAGWVSAATQ